MTGTEHRLRSALLVLKSRKARLRVARRDLEEAENVVADWEKAVADTAAEVAQLEGELDHEKGGA